jgi:hypothetical protein
MCVKTSLTTLHLARNKKYLQSIAQCHQHLPYTELKYFIMCYYLLDNVKYTIVWECKKQSFDIPLQTFLIAKIEFREVGVHI